MILINGKSVVAVLACCIGMSSAFCQPVVDEISAEASDTLQELPYWKKSGHWLEDSRNNWSERVDWLARGIDQFFAGKDTLDSSNKSYIRLRMGGAWVEGGDYLDDSDFKFRLHLPATERRFSIIIESESEEKESLEQKARPSLSQDNKFDDSRIIAALEFVRSEAKLWKTRSLLGVKAEIPGDVFVKYSARRRWELSGHWTMPYKFKVAYYVIDGWEVDHSLAFQRPLENELFFSATSSLAWTEEDDITRASQVFSLKKRLGDKKGIEYSVGILGEEVAKPHVTSYFVSAHYRELLYKDWLYWNLIPEINFPEEDNFKSVASFTVRFEVFFQQ